MIHKSPFPKKNTAFLQCSHGLGGKLISSREPTQWHKYNSYRNRFTKGETYLHFAREFSLTLGWPYTEQIFPGLMPLSLLMGHCLLPGEAFPAGRGQQL